ncbi:hypothetical protein BXZ70DRAFT_894126 [Cristinia sonorae]|uniref:Uncharacterized protein n=1 Tax=Cristinia sonorae TaxID=1940300 RepID=A0A8K0UNS8_9AGAR|nr:hypothetical protein BXZ70DRAFT_894126 [Cristinia sonorae]
MTDDGAGDDRAEDDDIEPLVFGGPFLDDNDEGPYVDLDDEVPDDDNPPSDDEDEDDPIIYDDAEPWEAPPPVTPESSPEPDQPDPLPPPGRQNIEEALRQDVYVQDFPGSQAGKPVAQRASMFSTYLSGTEAEAAAGDNPYAPFPSRRDWLIARWAKLRGPGSTSLDELLDLDGVQEDLGISFSNSRELNKIIDKQLPSGRPQFRCKEVTACGEAFDVYYRDPLECVKALYGDPNFAADLVFKPERHYADADQTIRMYHELFSGKWWWQTQKSVEKETPGATIVPIIISSDKTRLTNFKGKTAYPVYLTIGNIPKEVRRKPSLHSQILLAYLPVTRLEHIKNKKSRRRVQVNLFHTCMGRILRPLERAGLHGEEMASGDGVVRRCHTIFAAHIGDYPEQVLATGTKYGDCPSCETTNDELGDHEPGVVKPFRDLEAILDALETLDSLARTRACREAGIKPIDPGPYWEHLPYCDIFLSITPDILHQLYQGVVKHLVEWIKTAYNKSEIDARCRRLPPNHHVRVFSKGITSLYQLTGREHSDISRVLLGLIIDMPLPNGAPAGQLVLATRAILDFLYLAQYPVHTDETLALLDNALDRFHANKQIFVDIGVRTTWRIPKLHFLKHFRFLIERTGTTDNFNTEYTERLHIDLAKEAYEATNAKDEFPQMTRWLERREKIHRHEKYVQWCLAGRPPRLPSHIAIPPPSDSLKMTKHPSRKAVRITTLPSDYGAPYFVDALARYSVRHSNPAFTTRQVECAAEEVVLPFATIPVYHKARFWLGDIHNHRLSSNEYDVVHASPVRRDTRGRDVASRFDTVMVNHGHGSYSGVDGYQVAQIKVIFSLPRQAEMLFVAAPTPPPKYLAYIEWFTSFTVPDPYHRLYKIKRIVRNGHRMASVVPLRCVRRSVYLFPMFGTVVPRDWTSSNVLDRCSTFYVDAFSDRHAYHTVH